MLYDVTLRDGNHALRHSLTPEFVAEYCAIADSSDSYAVEVGHGNGIGASSFLVGKSKHTDAELLSSARASLKHVKLAVHTIPGFATIERDLNAALDLGVDLFRVATHSSEADVAERHIAYLKSKNVEVQGVLMMTHMIDTEELVRQALIHQAQGADAVIIMDSAGYYLPDDVNVRMSSLVSELKVPVGFHAHNNLGVAVTNAMTARDAGAEILDGSSMGLGAGAGNAQLENLAANLLYDRGDVETIRVYLKLSRLVEARWSDYLPRISAGSIESALSGVFSGYAPQVAKLSEELGIDNSSLWRAIGKRKLVAGQESMIREIAQDLMNL
jgi:4-hydroxy 2-oxovalerate aldolase